MKLSEIKIGTRHRRDMGDIPALAASMSAIGLLQPVVLNGSHELIAGGRRFQAAKSLGWKEINATVAETLDDVHRALQAERDENTCRKDFSPSEAAEMAAALEPFERQAAAERQAKAGPTKGRGAKPIASENISEPVAKGETRSKVAAAVGMSAPTLEKAKAVVEAAKAHPEAYADVQAKMDATGKVAPAYKEVVRRQVEEDAPKTRTPIHVPLGEDKYGDEDEDLPPVPDGPGPAEIVKNDPALNLQRMIHDLQGGINSFSLNGTLKKLRALPESKRRPLVKRLGELATDILNLKMELE